MIIRQPDSISRQAVLFDIPLTILKMANPHLNGQYVQSEEKMIIPGYWTREEENHPWSCYNPIEQERIRIVNGWRDLDNEYKNYRIPVKIKQGIVDVTHPYTYERLTNDLELLQTIFPFIHVSSIGKSTLGRELWEIRIGKGNKKIHFNAAMHANEWITSLVLMKWVNDYLLALNSGLKLGYIPAIEMFLETELSIVPMVNPDGVNLVLKGPPRDMVEQIESINHFSRAFTCWKANIRGVDLNKQFPARWDKQKEGAPRIPSPRDYPGQHPLSEAEVIHLARLIDNQSFLRVVALHTQGHEFYWGYEGYEPSQSEITARELEIRSGYKAVRYVDSHAGLKDWFILTYQKEGFTIELGKGINPLPLSQFNQIYEQTVHLLNAAVYV